MKKVGLCIHQPLGTHVLQRKHGWQWTVLKRGGNLSRHRHRVFQCFWNVHAQLFFKALPRGSWKGATFLEPFLDARRIHMSNGQTFHSGTSMPIAHGENTPPWHWLRSFPSTKSRWHPRVFFCKGVNLRWTTRHKRMINTSNPLVSTCSPRQSAPTSLPVSWKLASLPTVSQGQLWVQNASWAFQKLVPFGLQPAATMLYPGTPLQHVLYSVPSPVSHATSREPQIQSSSPTPYNSDQTSGV